MAYTASAVTAPNRAGTVVRSLLLFIARLAFAAILLAHAWWRWSVAGIDAQTAMLRDHQIPQAEVLAYATIVFEAMAGALLVLGLLTRFVSAVVVIEQALVIALIKLPSGVYLADGGFEYNAALATLGVVFLAVGAHHVGLDALFARGRRADRDDDELYQPALGSSQL
ncbi:hypothetical protein GCM10009785_07740 [Brooklawnia cerclae]|uniref:Oxidoreductase n=1 Tax=Brooklawnia cerclae TaxID=349934 RepID=A0ABX0SIW7_9ACTN|nr:DoxX family protein [Brooklawnia cerclae]NIH58352.1 putative oxidoreductase [Brooklawnia cerclae]